MKKLIGVLIIGLLLSTTAHADDDAWIDGLAAIAGAYNAERAEGIRKRKEEGVLLQQEYYRQWELKQAAKKIRDCQQNPYMCD